MEMVQGRYIDFSDETGTFIYSYTCPRCTKKHKSSSPELSAPTLCHRCLVGGRKGRRGKPVKLPKFRKDT